MNETELFSKIHDLSGRLGLIERKVDFMLQALKLEYHDDTPEPPYMAEVRALIAQHKNIDAITVYRRATGLGLADAKNFIENLPNKAD